MELVSAGEADLEVEVHGLGEPVVLIQTALIADELRPLASQPALLDHYRTVLYHRRGYAGSSQVDGPGSIARDAADCRALLASLGIDRAHLVGLSYSGAVAMQLAADAPELVHTLTLLEPPPVHVPSAPEFRAANARLRDTRNARGLAAALEEFFAIILDEDWRVAVERAVPGSAEQIERDTGTFFDTDLPALLAWQFTAADAGRIACPVLYVGGTGSGPWFAEVRELLLGWLPQADDTVIAGADHSLAITHAAEIAAVLVPFLRRHPAG
jgi:pimeloyl-ACP methyl ester carboxylesterase